MQAPGETESLHEFESGGSAPGKAIEPALGWLRWTFVHVCHRQKRGNRGGPWTPAAPTPGIGGHPSTQSNVGP
jgi:hypothetical protein